MVKKLRELSRGHVEREGKKELEKVREEMARNENKREKVMEVKVRVNQKWT